MPDVTAASVVRLAMACGSIAMAHLFYRSKRRPWQTALAWGLCLLAGAALSALLRPAAGGSCVQCDGFLSVLVYLYLFDVPVGQRLFTCFFVNTALYLAALLTRCSVLLVRGLWPHFHPGAAFAALYVLLSLAAFFLLFQRLRAAMVERLAQRGAHLGPLTAFACTGYVLLLLFDAWQLQDGLTLREAVLLLLYGALLVCGYLLSFSALTAVGDAAQARLQVRALTDQARQSEQYYLTLAGRIQEVRRMQHDSRHHLRVLSGYARAGSYDLLQAYLDTLMEQAPDAGALVRCANYTANILLSFYAEQARGAQIRFTCDAQIPADLACAPVDLCAVLGNALQNALDACARQGPEACRYISVLARMVGDSLTLEMKNSYDGVAEEREGKLLSRKEGPGHGLGLSSIQRVAEQYHGHCSVSRTGREFVLRVVLAQRD